MGNIKIGITHGDVNGIGYEVIIKALSEQKIYDGKTFIVYGSPRAAAIHRKTLDVQNFSFNQIQSADDASPKKPNIIDCLGEDAQVDFGMETAEAGRYAIKALQAACDDLKKGKIDVLVTMPVNKASIAKASIAFQSHAMFLGKVFNTTQHTELFVNDSVKVCYVSNATKLSQIPGSVKKDAILEKIVALHDSLRVDYGKTKPKIAVLSLNSEMGEEEKEIQRVVEDAKNSGFVTSGPYLPEMFFATAEYRKFDGVVGMYRDQVVTPFKALSFDDSLSLCVGLPKISVAPAMVVDFAKAGKNAADESPLRYAIFSACDLLKKRAEYAELTKNQLK